MTTTIDGTNITFVDGSTFTGANTASQLVPDTNSSETATSFNVGYLALTNTIFYIGGGFISAGRVTWGLNQGAYALDYAGVASATVPQVNLVGNSSDYLGHQNFYLFGSSSSGVSGLCAGTWKPRGHAMNTGIYQNFGNFVLLERVA
jgi:hypothetical protein